MARKSLVGCYITLILASTFLSNCHALEQSDPDISVAEVDNAHNTQLIEESIITFDGTSINDQSSIVLDGDHGEKKGETPSTEEGSTVVADVLTNNEHGSSDRHAIGVRPTTGDQSTAENDSAKESKINEESSVIEEPLTEDGVASPPPRPGPAYLFSSVRKPTPEEITASSLSSTLLTVTKDILSFKPRHYRNVSLEFRMAELQRLDSREVTELLSQRGIVVPPLKGINCDLSTQYYRTMDGSCNNFLFPCWGKTSEPYLRWLPPAYANGIDAPRVRADGNPLPSPRQVYQWVSSQFEQSANTTYSRLTNFMLLWGQAVAHDILLTPQVVVKVWDGKDFEDDAPECCEPSGRSHTECIPIVMNFDDSFYSREHCLSIARSAPYVYSPFSCRNPKLGLPRAQINQLTAFLDASLVYGESEKKMRGLREKNGFGARLIMDLVHGIGYPPRRKEGCKSGHPTCDPRCFHAGEKRANENPVLASLHTIWVREHNRLVEALRGRGWSEETLFHVVRKMVGAMFQHITYKEYLPEVIGPALTSVMNLTIPTVNYRYNQLLNPTLYNVFVSAAYRYGHSMISSRYMRRGTHFQASPWLSEDFFSMDEFCKTSGDSIAPLLYGQADQNVQKVDCLFSKQVTNHLFSDTANGPGLDLFSLNIQRGRDHGLPPYNKWREACGLPKIRDYPDLRGIIPDYLIDRFATVYGPGAVDEIDLYVAGVSEFPVNGGILGPTYTCIVSNQFKNLKFGDRFWYENLDHPGAFTKEQILSIQKTTLASLLCRNSDIQYIQPNAFIAVSASNPKLHCNFITRDTDLDLNLWL